jgi:hypothetical protein
MLEYRLICMRKSEQLLEPVVEDIETYAKYSDINVAWEEAQEINEQCGAWFVPAMVH